MTVTDDWTDQQYRAWMDAHLARAAAVFALRIDGEPVYGWNDRSVSTAAVDRDGERCWLRVGSEQNRHLEHQGPYWTGAVEANVIENVLKPRVLATVEWDAPELDRRVRADLLTWMPGTPCAPTEVLREPLRHPERWWTALRDSLDALQAVDTDRYADRPPRDERVRGLFGDTVLTEVRRATERRTQHGDLHWNNIFGPNFALMDWEMWGSHLLGSDQAMLYLRTLLVPETSRRLHALFADVLDSPAGLAAQIRAAAVLLHRSAEFPDLEDVLRRHIHQVIGALVDHAPALSS